MRQSSGPQSAEKHAKEIRRRTRRKFSAEEKIRIVLAGLRGEASIAELCRREGVCIAPMMEEADSAIFSDIYQGYVTQGSH